MMDIRDAGSIVGTEESRARRPRVLFLCVENSCRSQLAEALGRRAGLDAWSAGSRPSGRVHPGALAALAERGCDAAGQRSEGVDALPHRRFDVVVSMGCGDDCAEVEAPRREDWPVPDPKHGGPDAFRRARDDIAARVARLARELRGDVAREAGA